MTEEWKNRIYNYEVKPPAKAWEKITSALDDSHLSDQFPSLLHEMAVTPPGRAWEKISAQLNEDVPAGRIYRRMPPFLRYAAAAVVIGLVAFGGVQLLKNRKSEQAQTIPVAKVEKSANTPENSIETEQVIEERRNNLALEESKQTLASLETSRSNKKRISSYNDFINSVESEPEVFAFAPENTYKDLDYSDMTRTQFQGAIFGTESNLADRYIMLITPEGNIIRMSKKLGDLVCCVSGEEQDEDCKSQLDKWRSKIMSAQIHSTGNFMDILSLVNSLQSNNH